MKKAHLLEMAPSRNGGAQWCMKDMTVGMAERCRSKKVTNVKDVAG